MKRILVVGMMAGGVLVWSRPALAQIPVIDSANLLQTTNSAIQNVLQTVQQVAMVASWALDLATIGSMAIDGGELEGDLGTLMALAGEVGALSYDLQRLEQQIGTLFALETAPATSTAMAARTREVRAMTVQAYQFAFRTQTLLRTLQRTVQHIVNITNRIGELSGNLSSQQNGQEYLVKLTQLETQAAVQATAMQRAQAIQAVNDPIDQQAISNIKFGVRVDMPR